MGKIKCTAIVLAAGQGSRMGTKVRKQFLEIKEKPLVYYSLLQFQKCDFIDEIIIVTGEEDRDYCQDQIVTPYHFSKVTNIVAGGRERYNSVYHGLQYVQGEYVLIHDGARPFLDSSMLERVYQAVQKYQACVVGMPVKDTIKEVNSKGQGIRTLNREALWQIQTPQAFQTSLIKTAYEVCMSKEENLKGITDDAMVLENFSDHFVQLVEGSYRNIKVTTPEDLIIAEAFLDFSK